MRLAKKISILLILWLLSVFINQRLGIPVLSVFSLLYGIYLVLVLIQSIGMKIPYYELTFAAFGIQLLIAPYLEYHFFHNEIFGVMLVSEENYFSFVTPAIFLFYLGFELVGIPLNEPEAKIKIGQDQEWYGAIGIKLIVIGFLFYFLTMLHSNFIFISLSYLRFLGAIYLWLSNHANRRKINVFVWGLLLWETLKGAIFINLLIWIALLFCFLILGKRMNKVLITCLLLISVFLAVVLQSVKQEYREYAWDDDVGNDIALSSLMIKQVRHLDAELFKNMGGLMNIRINQGWIISHGMNNLNGRPVEMSTTYFSRELISILLPRFLYPNKIEVGSREKFEQFTGWALADTVAMNLGIIGDAYFNFRKNGGILFCFILGLLLGFFHKFYLNKLLKYPDLMIWSVLFYFMVMRAGNEFYMIFNWLVKTGFITLLFFKYVRPYWQTQHSSLPSKTILNP